MERNSTLFGKVANCFRSSNQEMVGQKGANTNEESMNESRKALKATKSPTKRRKTPSEMTNPETNDGSSKASPDTEFGIKTLYRNDPRVAWDDIPPPSSSLPLASDDPSIQRYPLIARYETTTSGSSPLELHSVTIQSPLLKQFLEPIFDGYLGISTKLSDLTFSTPFHEFFYRWDTLQAAIEEEQDGERKRAAILLESVMKPEITPHLERRDELVKHGLITFHHLWALFEPDQDIHSTVDGQNRLFKLISCRYQRTQAGIIFVLDARFVDTDGTSFGYVSTTLTIEEFEGILPISELDVLPAELVPGLEGIRKRLEERGSDFRELRGCCFREYSGFYITRDGYFGGPKKSHINKGRIVIDAKTYGTYNHEDMPKLQPFSGSPQAEDDENFHEYHRSYSEFDSDSNDSAPPKYRTPKPRSSQAQIARSSKPTPLPDNLLIYTTPMLRGYCLTTKQWVSLYITNISEITWNPHAFSSLVLPHDYKELVLAFVESQLNGKDRFDDIVQGKGQGIIMLLSGEPGVGKTLTAESEETHRPLYSLSAGELGLTASEVETSLARVLSIATEWNCILLLDECDVFLSQRTISDIERNKLVSVFLRLLEYFKGVLFLTTNRLDELDKAFESRIHLVINYPALDQTARGVIWRNFLEREGGAMGKPEMRELEGLEFNGREIKNIIKTAKLLASRKGEPLGIEHIRTVLRVKKGLAGHGAERQIESSGTCDHCGK